MFQQEKKLHLGGNFIKKAGRVASAGFCMERAMGIEPTTAAWEAAVLPLNYARTKCTILLCTKPKGMSRPGGNFLPG
jgi:hypothetical protein